MLTCGLRVDSFVAVMSQVVSPWTWMVVGSHVWRQRDVALLVEERHREVQRACVFDAIEIWPKY